MAGLALGAVLILLAIRVFQPEPEPDQQQPSITPGQWAADDSEQVLSMLTPRLMQSGPAAFNEASAFLVKQATPDRRYRLLYRPATSANLSFYEVVAAPAVDARAAAAAEPASWQELASPQGLDQLCAAESPVILPDSSENVRQIRSASPFKSPRGCWILFATYDTSALVAPASARQEQQAAMTSEELALVASALALMMLIAVVVIRRRNPVPMTIQVPYPSAPSYPPPANAPTLNDGTTPIALAVAAAAEAEQAPPPPTNVPISAGQEPPLAFPTPVPTEIKPAPVPLDVADAIRRDVEDRTHALKTPLATIRHSLQPVKRALSTENDRAQRAFDLIELSIDRLETIVSGSQPPESEPAAEQAPVSSRHVDLSGLIGRMLNYYSTMFTANKIILVDQIHPEILINALPGTIERIFGNIVDNAISFSPPGGTVSVVLIRGRNYCELVVEDEGPGVEPDQLTHVFDRYFTTRADAGVDESNPSVEDKHSGLGLWIARRNAESIGGHISAANRDTRGFCVRVTLPTAG